MPHRNKLATLRSSSVNPSTAKIAEAPPPISEFRTMSAIAALKHGLVNRLHRNKGWLLKLLVKEGSFNATISHMSFIAVLLIHINT